LVIKIAYIFKPRTRQVDEIAEVVRELKIQGFEDLTISRFYEYAAERALEAYRHDRRDLLSWLNAHRSGDRAGR
jgi:hypothetical protein